MPELLVAWVAFCAIQILTWLGCGSLVARVVPGEIPRSLLAPIGFCVVVVAGGYMTAIPGLAGFTTPLVVVMALAGLVLAPPWRGRRPSPWLAGGLIAVFAVYAAPIVLSGSATFAGYIRLDDTATWLALTDRVMDAGRDIDGLAPSSYEATLFFNLADGYPVGAFIPLGVGRALTGMDAAWLIQPYMALLAVLLALALWDLSGRLLASARARALVVLAAAQPALLYGYYLWGGLKELAAAALIALVACLAFRAARQEGDRVQARGLTPGVGSDPAGFRLLVPVALAIAALIGCLSLAGAVWVGPLLLGALAYSVAAASPRVAAVRAATLVGLVAVMVVPVVLGGALLPPTSSPLDDPSARGNLIEPLSALQTLGIWPAGDFRVDADQMSVTTALCVFAGAAALTGWVVAARGRRWDLVAYLVGVPAAALAISLVGSPWVEGKAFAIVSPVLLFAAFLACIWAWSERRFILGAGVAALLGCGVVWSNALAYNEANLAPRDQLAELEEIGEMLDGDGPVLMTEYQPYGVRHFLRDADAEGASELRRRVVPLADGSTLAKGLWADTDDFRADAFEPYEALVLRRSPEQSRPPGEYELDWAGDYYEVWVRGEDASPASERLPLGQGRSPVAEPQCTEVRELARVVPGGTLRAAEGREPVLLQGSQGEVDLSGGLYSIWLDDSVRGVAELRIDGEEVSSVHHFLNNEGLYTLLGELELDSGRHEISVSFGQPFFAPGSGGQSEHGSLAVKPETEARLTTMPAEDAAQLCGEQWDWVEAVP
ncbi:MAG: hypothetical protein QOI31_2715 [Solirubrobacterales bacterium]|jgi:hypothetical protein|nr:hypothetical protein [Solirubrobacterales bacterium]